jgi:UDPglucose 6-dehydrogenase
MIGIIGLGTVGSSLLTYFRDIARLPVIGYDPKIPQTNIQEVLSAATRVCFLCLPTEHSNDGDGGGAGGSGYDLSALQETLDKLQTFQYRYPVIIKSTLLPGTTARFARDFPTLHLVHCPEFLSERTRDIDTRHPKQIILGFPPGSAASTTGLVHELMTQAFPEAPVHQVDSDTSEAVKVFTNAFYFTKLAYFNDVYEACQQKKINYDLVRLLMLNNGWIHPMHTTVPGYDGKTGVGGRCLPKDFLALSDWCRSEGLHVGRAGVMNDTRDTEKNGST